MFYACARTSPRFFFDISYRSPWCSCFSFRCCKQEKRAGWRNSKKHITNNKTRVKVTVVKRLTLDIFLFYSQFGLFSPFQGYQTKPDTCLPVCKREWYVSTSPSFEPNCCAKLWLNGETRVFVAVRKEQNVSALIKISMFVETP